MKTTMETIRKAILKHHGGLNNATDAQIKTIWDSLEEETRKKYLQNLNERKGKDAVSDKTKRDV